MLSPPLPSNASYNASLLASGVFSDCTVRCQDRVWHLHRNILGPRCDFFRACLTWPPRSREDGKVPDRNAMPEVVMDDDDPVAVDALVRWLYTLEYPSRQGVGEEKKVQWTYDLKAYVIADKYGLDALAALAVHALLDTAGKIADATDPTACEMFGQGIDDFVNLVDALYLDLPEHATTTSLRKQIVKTLAGMIARSASETKISNLISGVPAFGIDLVQALAEGWIRAEKDHQTNDEFSSEASIAASDTTRPRSGSRGSRTRKVKIPMNEDSDDEY